MQDEQELIAAFHKMWDAFPGMARLINKKHEIIAANEIAVSKGFIPGAICAKISTPSAHRGCLLAKTLQSGKGCYDQAFPFLCQFHAGFSPFVCYMEPRNLSIFRLEIRRKR